MTQDDFAAHAGAIDSYDQRSEEIAAQGQDQNRESKSALMRAFFEQLVAAGVDPSDPQSVASYMERLKEDDPDAYRKLAIAFQVAFSDKIPAQGQAPSPAPAPPVV